MRQITKDIHRLKRIWFPSPAEKRFIKTMGWIFYLQHDVKREYKVQGYVADFCIPKKRVVIEVDGRNYHGGGKDIVRDMVLKNAGWYVYRIKAEELWQEPQLVRHYVKLFCRNPKAYIRKYG